MNTYTVQISETSDDLAWDCLERILKEDFGGREVRRYGGMAGSVDIWWYEVEVNGLVVFIEWENWLGVKLSGDKEIVDELANRFRSRMARQCK